MNSKTYDHDTLEEAGASAGIWPLSEVRRRRVLAFVMDYAIVFLLTAIAYVGVFILGILTLGLGWLLFVVLAPLVAMAYVGMTMGGPLQATPGMRMFSLRIERLDGRPVDPWLAILHGVIFWVAHISFTPVLLVVSLFNDRKQLVQDLLLGTMIVRTDR